MSRVIEAPRDFEHLTSNAKRAGDYAKRFRWEFMNNSFAPEGRATDRKISYLFQSLQGGQFWHVLGMLDGTPDQNPEEKNERRIWAQQTFLPNEIDSLVDLSVKIAMGAPFSTDGQPGRSRGHSVLHEMTLADPNSKIKDRISQSLEKRLNNGRFWEELPMMERKNRSSRVVNDVLENHFSDLELSFVKEGFNILDRNEISGVKWNFDGMTKLAVDRYVEFISSVDESKDKLGLSTDQIARLVAPYASHAVGVENDEDGFYKKIRYPLHSKRNYVKRLKEPLLSKYIAESDLVRHRFAKELKGSAKHIVEVMKLIPNPRDIFDNYILHHTYPEESLKNLIQESENQGISIIQVLGPKSFEILQEAEMLDVKT